MSWVLSIITFIAFIQFKNQKKINQQKIIAMNKGGPNQQPPTDRLIIAKNLSKFLLKEIYQSFCCHRRWRAGLLKSDLNNPTNIYILYYELMWYGNLTNISDNLSYGYNRINVSKCEKICFKYIIITKSIVFIFFQGNLWKENLWLLLKKSMNNIRENG